ncbi:restriction endonuclease subunit S [Bifidobacterium tibiigranuli]|jgi:type I restriction enzyme S subunit|uniref:restriction endonuclease subunit S n=1 Tax=Bifidobacterium tibiigranuli TaxID=2172043 RepID=UPI0026F1F6DA|nr:restriction endonuclease subunit S [Bifidobacterium tibiigranuli]MCI1712650.1 restriction endonuclease subunit S [Bifidobacterium tibiigranuli]
MTTSWYKYTLGDLCSFQAGGAFPRAEQGHVSGNYPFIKVSDMTLPANSKRIVEANNWVSSDTAERMRLKLVPAGAVAFAKIGEGLKAERLRQITRPTAMDNNMMAAVPKPGKVDEHFLQYLIESLHIASWAQGSALPYLSQGVLSEIPVRTPGLSEQCIIAAILGSLDDKIESNRRAISLSENLARALFSKLFDLEPVENGVALSDLMIVNSRHRLYKGNRATYVGMSSLPEFSSEIYHWEQREFGSGQRFVNGDVLMARITPCLENGKTAVVDMLGQGEVGWGSTEYIVLSPSGLFSTSWIYCLLRDERIRNYAIRSMTGTSGRQRFQADRFQQYKISMPRDETLKEFNSISEPLFHKMTQLRNENCNLAALRDALLPELLSGRIQVPTEERFLP